MRLTLRTMLAYLDDILEPDDRADLGKKIEDSEFATKLVHRIRDTTQRLRLGAPKLTGRGMGLDANTVAEYLDNTLSAERVPDFEKVCLESDVHLAEVAACHQVLTLVLGEPAEVEPTLRRRMYQIGSGESVGVDSPHLRADQAGQLDPGHKPVPLREKPQIPDYLRDTKRSGLWTAAAILLLAAVVGGGLVLAVGPEKVSTFLGWGPASSIVAHNEHPRANAAANSNDNVTQDANGAHANAPSGTNSGNPTPEEASPGATNPEAANPNSADTKGNNSNSNPSVPLVNPADLPPGPTESSAGTPGGNAATPASPTPNGAAPISPDKEGAASLPPTNPPAPDNVPGPTPNPADVASNSNPPIPANPNPLVPKPPVPNPPAPALTGDTPAPANPAVVPAGGPAGVFVSDEDVLMKWNTNGFWERVAIRAPVSFGDALLAFPTYRPTVLLNFGVSLQIGGETFLTLEPADADGIPGLNLTYGRIILTAAGKAGTKMRIRYGEHQGLLTFGDGASEAAIEVRPYHTPGSNPEKTPSQLLVDVYANSGQITWAPGSTVDAEVMQAPARLAVSSIPGEAL
ncbi:MAG TPA: hypothetical protein VFE24_03830, partial [Pirellulales bacterium]|nr:hypothetical protein [Pirellulales bacterium]